MNELSTLHMHKKNLTKFFFFKVGSRPVEKQEEIVKTEKVVEVKDEEEGVNVNHVKEEAEKELEEIMNEKNGNDEGEDKHDS